MRGAMKVLGDPSPTMAAGVCLVGAFPPPVHGVSLVNANMLEQLEQRGGDVSKVDLSSGALSGSFRFRARRLGRVLKGLATLLRPGITRNVGTMYVGLSGAYGQVYELAFVLVARLRGLRIFLHHNSYRYVRRRRVLSALLFWLAGPAAHHIVVCEDMGERLEALYPSVRRVHMLSNAAMLSAAATPRPKTELRKVGFFGNVSYEKGISEFLGVIARTTAEHPAIAGVIAGPFMNPAVAGTVRSAVERQRGISYVGARYGTDKDAFFNEIDVLLFPSSYEHEADPLTVHEAMRQGVPAICWNRGCLATVVESDCGLVIPGDSDFVEAATNQIRDWCEHPVEFAAASLRCIAKASALRVEVAGARESVVVMLLAGNTEEVGRIA